MQNHEDQKLRSYEVVHPILLSSQLLIFLTSLLWLSSYLLNSYLLNLLSSQLRFLHNLFSN